MDEFIEQGFEVVTGENGEELVKLVLVNENNESTGYALVSPEEARQILAGNATLQNATDEGETEGELEQAGQDMPASQSMTSFDTLSKVISNTDSLQGQLATAADNVAAASEQYEAGDPSALGGVEEFTLTERSVIVKNQPVQQVLLTDSQGIVLDQKEGLTGDKVTLEMGAQALEYVIQGPTETGEPITATLLVTPGDAEDEDQAVEQGMEGSGETEQVIVVPSEWAPSTIPIVDFDALRIQAVFVARQIKSDDAELLPEQYHRKLGSYQGYQEMLELCNTYNVNKETLDRYESLRKHAVLFRALSPSSRPLHKFEHTMNEAAAQICRFHPNLLFHKRELAIYAKQLITAARLNIPNDSSMSGAASASGSLVNVAQTAATQQVVTNGKISGPRQRPPLGDNSVHYFSNIPMIKQEQPHKLNGTEESALQQSATQLLSELTHEFPLKPRTECSNIERFCYEDAQRLMRMSEIRRDECLDFIREVSAVHGRYQNGQRNHSIVLTPLELAINEAASILVRGMPGLLTHRRELMDLAKRVVKASGLYFKHTQLLDKMSSAARELNPAYRLMSSEIPPELDLSAAEQILTDTLEYDDTGHNFLDSESTDTEGFDSDGFLSLTCEESNNILMDTAIFCVTGADDLKKVRILNLTGCSFTSILPAHLNKCVNLVELNLEGNCIRTLPRCLHLPHLKWLNLRGNRLSTPPLIEQFPKLLSLTVDDSIVSTFNHQVLAYFCPNLNEINGEYISTILTEENVKNLTTVKASIEAMVHSKWDEDYVNYFKKGVPKSEGIKLIESFVLFVIERGDVVVEEPFGNFKDVLARRIAEEFLDPKLLDDEEEEDSQDVDRGTRDSDEEIDEDEEEEARRARIKKRLAARKLAQEEAGGSMASFEGRVLLPDEPLDKVSNVVGQAMQQGKCVVYSVVRTAARQAGGDLIPVGGAPSSPEAVPVSSRKEETLASQTAARKSDVTTSVYDLIDSDMENSPLPFRSGAAKKSRPSKPGPLKTKKLKTPTGVARAAAAQVTKPKAAPSKAPKTPKTPGKTPSKAPVTDKAITPLEDRLDPNKSPVVVLERALPSSIRAATVAMPPAAPPSPVITPSKMVETPPSPVLTPHEPPPATLNMSTRDSNRMKRFSQYGVIDTAASNRARNERETAMAEREADLKRRRAMVSAAKRQERLAAAEAAAAAQEAEEEEEEEVAETTIKKPTTKKRPSSASAVTPSKKRAVEAPKKGLKDIAAAVDYDPLHFIRCHARDNDPMDCETKVWRCAFEPRSTSHTETTNVVATCGGECVCLIDCRTGKVMKRFKHQGEEFYTVAWTTVEMAAGHHTNLLAAAGKLREIRLLHPEQLVCYAELKGHKDDIACMVFHPNQPTVLFSGDAKANVLVWDIGVPSAPEYRTKHQLLMRLVCLRPNLNPVLNLAFLGDHNALVAGCEDGVFVWTFKDFSPNKKTEREPDFELKVPTKQEPCFDGLAKLSESSIVLKCVEEGELHIIDFDQVLKRRKGQQKAVYADIRGHLRWQTTEEIYINVTARPILGAVVCGDNEGAIWLYDVLDNIKSDSKKKFRSKPVKILEWPECSVGGSKDEDKQLNDSISAGFKNPVVNATDLSSDGRYLVAVTDNNLVCIWKISS